MEKVSENMNKYGEEMKGKFSHNPRGNGTVISVTNPFVQEIHIDCDDDISNTYWDTYSLLAPQANHPMGENRKIYYNTREQCYYRFEWQPKKPEQERSEWKYIWVKTDSEYIVKHARSCEKLQAHFRTYDKMHKGQLCIFRCYAIDPNGNPKKPSTIESMFDRHKWFYSPWPFKFFLLNGDTIDDFVEETPISKEMADKMVLYHKKQRKDELKSKVKELGRNLLDKLSKAAKFVEKYPTWFVAILTALATYFFANITSILKWFAEHFEQLVVLSR